MRLSPLDSEGRLFGRVNLIDALVLAFILGLVPLAYVAYIVFRQPSPIVTSIKPAIIAPNGSRRLHVVGEHFVPYLRAFFWKTGEPLALLDRVPSTNQGRFMIESPVTMEIEVPPELPPGTYDLYLFDETQEVAHQVQAFSIQAPKVEDGEYDVRARFVMNPEIVALVRPNDVDSWPDHSAKEIGRIVTVEPVTSPATQLELIEDRSAPGYFGSTQKAAVLTLTLRVQAHETEGVRWYRTQALRAGERLLFQTDEYVIRGTVISVTKATNGAPMGR